MNDQANGFGSLGVPKDTLRHLEITTLDAILLR